MNKQGYKPAEIHSTTSSRHVSRGREQIHIDKMGGAKSTGGTSGNKINGIAQTNPKAQTYLEAAKKALKE